MDAPMTDHDEHVQEIRSALQDVDMRSRAASAVRIPKRYSEAHVSHFKQVPREPIDGIFITGAPGVGKTYLAAALLMHWMPVYAWDGQKIDTSRCLWYSIPRFVVEMRDSNRNSDIETQLEQIRPISNRKLLVLDDLGAEKPSEYSAQALYLLISERLDEMRPTIVTSNLTLPEIEVFDPRLASRLFGMDHFVMEGRDRRGDKHTKEK